MTSLPPRASDMLAVRDRAIDGAGLSPARFAALPAATRTFTSKLLSMPSTQRTRLRGSALHAEAEPMARAE
jgi:hypothetical protein